MPKRVRIPGPQQHEQWSETGEVLEEDDKGAWVQMGNCPFRFYLRWKFLEIVE